MKQPVIDSPIAESSVTHPELIEINLVWKPGVTFRDLTLQTLGIVLDSFQGNKMRTARALDISTRTIRNRINTNELMKDLSN